MIAINVSVAICQFSSFAKRSISLEVMFSAEVFHITKTVYLFRVIVQKITKVVFHFAMLMSIY